MTTCETPHENVGNEKKSKKTYCLLCRKFHFKREVHEHMHGMLHHRELERVLGKNTFHQCQACNTLCVGLNEYAAHISTAQHKAKLTVLASKNVKPLSLFKTLDQDTINRIKERNKTLKNQEKKARKKKKKKQKQAEGQKQAEMQQKTNIVPTQKLKVKKYQKVRLRIWKQVRELEHEGSTNAVFQNKENNQSRRFVYWPESPAGQAWHHPHAQGQFPQSSQHPSYDSSFSASGQFSRASVSSSQPDTHLPRPDESQWDAAEMTEPASAVSQTGYHNRSTYGDFTSDCLPQNGAIIFDQSQGESSGSSQPRQEGSAQPASAKKSDNAAPIQDVDVSAMLKQIRRVLGVREPCRADREARRQNATRQAGPEVKQRAGVSFRNHAASAPSRTVPSPQANTPPSAAVCSSTVPNPRALSKTQEAPRYCKTTSVAADGQSGSRERESQAAADSWASLEQSTVKATSFEPKRNNTTKVRIAHKAAEDQGSREARLKPTLNKLLSLSGARSKSSWSQICDNMKRKKLKGIPRFGIELVNRPTIQESFTQPKDSDLPLSEGFHWESVPDDPSLLRMTLTPPPPQQTAAADCRTETQSDTQTQKPVEQPNAALKSCSSQTGAGFSVKVESNLKDENGDSTNNSVTNKRKEKMLTDDGFSDQEPRRKKKKMKSNKYHNPMDQLLVVSLREEELSQSLQDLDQSLFQARNALQAAYAEVQRLMLLRQQFTAEVNGLRAKRIEILQEMQEGYTGASNLAEKTSTSSVLPATTVQPPSLSTSCAFPSSSTQQTPPTTSASSSPQPQPTPPALSAKQEVCQLPTAGQASYFPNTVSCNTDAPQVSMKPPVPLFPPNLLPSLLLPPPHLTTPATAAASAQQPTAESSTSVNTPPPESSVRQQEQEKRKGTKDCVRTAVLATEADPAESVCEEVAAGSHSKGQVELKEPATDKSVHERHKSAAGANDEGNQSDDSVEVIGSSSSVVIHIESDHEESPETESNVPAQPERPQSTASTQTLQQTDSDRKIEPLSVTAKEEKSPAEPVEDEEPSEGAFEGHTGPVLGLQVHDGLLYTCSGDNTARAYSLVNRECQAVFEGHTNKINCLLVSSLPNMPARLYTGSSDQTVRCYSIKSKKCLEQISLPDRVLCLHIAWHILYVGLASGSVASFDLKTLKQLDVFECHGPRGVSCLGTAQEGARRLLLVGSYDSTISVRDAKSGLLLRSLEGHSKTVLCLKVVNDLVFSGSSDTSVHAHNIHTGELIRIYKGHGQAVTSIVILGKVMVTSCLDKLVRVYELQSHDRLQVYGGHSDMVMCMAVHKSVIYTGCYDGSVQAVKLNLMQNYRCWWQNCSLIFGMSDHLVQHLVRDHSNPNMQMLKCRWRGCDTFFATRQSVKEELPEHMQGHVENDSEVQL